VDLLPCYAHVIANIAIGPTLVGGAGAPPV